jgi:hypothetical protein
MLSAGKYSAIEVLRNGRQIEIRALRSDERAGLLDAVERTSAQSRYRRFFDAKRDFSQKEIEFFLNIDFVNYVALVATAEEDSRAVIVGGGRYIIVRPGAAEVCRGRRIPGTRHRRSADAPSHRDCSRCRARGTGRGGSTRQHADAEGVRKKRASLQYEAGGPGRSRRASAFRMSLDPSGSLRRLPRDNFNTARRGS